MMKLLIAYDGSPRSDEAIEDLTRAGLPEKVEANIVTIADYWLPGAGASETETPVPEEIRESVTRSREHATRAVQEAQSLAEKARDRVQTLFPTWTVQAQAFGATPAWGLVQKADEWKPDLIVLGSHGKSAIQRVLLGSTSQTVLTHVSCSVRVVHGNIKAPHEPIRILIGVDGSQGADAALRAVIARQWPANTLVKLLAVSDLWTSTVNAANLPGLAFSSREGLEQQETWLEQAVENSAKQVRAAGLNVETEMRDADPKLALVDEAEQWNADCIFIGARGLSTMERLFLGSVSTSVCQRASCTVEVIRLAETAV